MCVVVKFVKDDVELNEASGGGGGNKKFQSIINQSHGYTFGEGSAHSVMKTSCANSQVTPCLSDDEAKLKLTSSMTTSTAAADMRRRRSRACQLKTMIVMLALLAAAFIGCLIAYFFMRYNSEHMRYLKYTKNMVAERNCKSSTPFFVSTKH